jgi:hypothetical protein
MEIWASMSSRWMSFGSPLSVTNWKLNASRFIGVKIFPQASILHGWCPLPEYWLAKSLSKAFYLSIDGVVLEVRILLFVGGITLPGATIEAFEISSLNRIGSVKARQCPIRQSHIKELFIAFEKYIESML